MKSITFFLIAFICLFAQCQKDDEYRNPDLSDAGNLSSFFIAKGYWVLYYQDIDSISKNLTVYLDKDWPSNKASGYETGILLSKIDNDNLKYLHFTKFESSVDDKFHIHIDTVTVSSNDGTIFLNIYNMFSYMLTPVKMGVFAGKYNKYTRRIEGFYRHGVTYRIGSVPGPGGENFRNAIANVNAFCD
jgi:hypothetical protein